MAPAACSAAPAGHRVSAPVPVAWLLEGDVLAEYLLFLEETATPPAPPAKRAPVAWLEGEARDEFLRFLEESRAKEAAAEVGLEQQQHGEEEEHGSGDAARGGGGDADGHNDGCGLVVDDGGESDILMEDDDAGAMEEDDGSGDGGVCVEKHEQEAEQVLELLLPHILDLPAFRARAEAPAPAQQESVLGFPWYHGGGWMQNRVSLIEVDSCTSSSTSDEEMSSVEEEFEEVASLCDQQLASESSFRHSHTS